MWGKDLPNLPMCSKLLPPPDAAGPACEACTAEFVRGKARSAIGTTRTLLSEPRRDDHGKGRARPGALDPKTVQSTRLVELPEQHGAHPVPCSRLCYAG